MLNAKSSTKVNFGLRTEAISHYSHSTMTCANPYNEHEKPYTTLAALSIDHINGGGSKHRKELGGGGTKFYRWLKKHNYPEGFQVLCMNCQFIKKNGEAKRKYMVIP